MDFNVVFFSQVTQRLGIAELLMLHDEIYRATALATSKALANALGARDIKRWPAVIVEWTQPNPVCSTMFERHKIAHDIHNVGSIDDLLYGIMVNHRSSRFCEQTTSGIRDWSTAEMP